MLAKPNGEPERERIYEPKLDGYRLIIHHNRLKHQRGYETKAYTRRMNDVTESLPELEEITELEEGIYDCEVLANDGTYKSTSERIGRKDVNNPENEMTFWIFDCIKSGDNDLTKLPYESRRQTLMGLVDGKQVKNVEIVPTFTNYRNAKSYAKERDLEGVMCKNPKSEYIFGKRSGNWRKIKYTDATADVRITDMVEGNGRLSGSMGKLKLETQKGVDVGYVGTGFSDEQRKEIWNNKDEWMGEIIEVTFEDYDAGLRFPRFERHRDEGQVDTEQKIKSLV
jgi:ATP-dependent DNA ligase